MPFTYGHTHPGIVGTESSPRGWMGWKGMGWLGGWGGVGSVWGGVVDDAKSPHQAAMAQGAVPAGLSL